MTSTKNSVLQYIYSDLTRYYGKANWKILLYRYLTDPQVRWHCMFRLYRGAKWQRLLSDILYIFNKTKRYIQIPRSTAIGYGLYIGHGGPIIINPTCKIGNNCNLSQFTTIGSNEHHAATIGNNVYIGPNVCLVEDVHIGDNATIGAGSIVTKNIPSNATAVGNYAKVINYNNPGRYITNRWTNTAKE